jgi:hypothetical protein
MSKWRKPPENVIKLNCDGAIQTEGRIAASGVIARDN